ncbi:MAG: HD-GYP domain-containing protein [Desulfovibrionaceae bacterium]
MFGNRGNGGGRGNGTFFPVSPLLLFPDVMGTFSVFLRQGKDFVLYTRSGERFSERHRQNLHASGVTEVYVQTEDKPDFDRYVEQNLGRVLDNEELTPSDRSRVLYTAAEDVLEEVFDTRLPAAARGRQVERIGGIVRQSLDFLADERTLKAMAPFIRHDYKTYTHSLHVFLYTVSLLIGEGYAGEELYEVGLGAMLHDLGKARIPLTVLNKKGTLNDQERDVIRTHPLQGVAMCANLEVSQLTFNCILFHHERMDGGGYPSGIGEDDIPVPVRAITLCDVYDALTSKRPYAEARTPFEALTVMRYDMKGHFDMAVFKRFVEMLSGADIA